MDKLESQSLKEAAWRSRLLRHAQGSKSIAAFCRDESVSTASFHIWRAKLAACDLAHAPPAEFLTRFPYIDKETAMAQQSAFLNEWADRRFLLYATSHGSMGTGIGIWRSKRDSDIEKAFYRHAWAASGSMSTSRATCASATTPRNRSIPHRLGARAIG